MAEAENLPDIDHGLDSLTEETTAAEFLRSKGQNKKVKTINKDKLKQWIGQAIVQSRAATVGAYNDEEKEELLKKTQGQLEEVMARAAKAESEVKQREQQKLKMAQEISSLQKDAADETANEGEQLKQAMATVAKLQMEYEQAHRETDDLRLDVYELQDQLNTKMALSRTIIEEKDRLKTTMQGLMVRAGDLSGGVLQLDQAYYAGRHSLENEAPDDVEMSEQFFHDFEVGSKVIESLSTDLEKLREITDSQAADDVEAENSGAPVGLLSRDLELLEQLKAGSLDAVDVAQPVEGLIEALEGARQEANTLEIEAMTAMGMPQAATTVSALPDADGEAATVIAGATTVARELATLFAKERKRLAAMQAMADNADEERNSEEAASASLETFYAALLLKLSHAATAAGLEADSVLEDQSADPAAKHTAAGQLIEALSEVSSESTQAVVDSYDALLASIAQDAEEAGVETVPALSDGSAKPAQRQEAAEQVLDALAEKNNEDVQVSYERLLACIAKEVTDAGVDAPDDLTNDDAEAVQREAAAEEALQILSEQSQGAQNMDAMQDEMEEVLRDLAIEDVDHVIEDRVDVAIDDTIDDTTDNTTDVKKAVKQDHDAVRVLFSNRIGLLVGKIKDLKQEHEDAQLASASALEEKNQDIEQKDQDLEQQKTDLEQKDAELKQKSSDLEEKSTDIEQKDADLVRAALELERALQDKVMLQEEAEAKAADASTSSGEAENKLAQSIMTAVHGDEELAGDDAVLDLALAVDDFNDELNDGDDEQSILVHCEKVVAALATRKLALMSELATLKAGQMDRDNKMETIEKEKQEAYADRDEMAESGREVIAQLTQQRDVRLKELDEVKTSAQENETKLSVLEDTVHGFADSLSDLAVDEANQSDEVAQAKIRAREAVSAMPGEKSVPLSTTVATSVCTAGLELMHALAVDGGASAALLQEQLDKNKQVLTEKNEALGQTTEQLEEKDAALTAAQEQLEERTLALTTATVQLEEKDAALTIVEERLQEKVKALDGAESTAVVAASAAAVAATVAASRIAEDKSTIDELTEQQNALQGKIDSNEIRLADAEAANRDIAQEIAALAGSVEHNEDMENLHADLEVTLSEIPEGEDEASREGLSKDLGTSGRAVLDAIKLQLDDRASEVEKARAERDELKGLLRDSKAAIEEYRARHDESAQANNGELKGLKEQVAALENAKMGSRKEMQEQIDDYRLEENVLKKKLAELSKHIETRDMEILALKKDGDDGADKSVELSSLQAQTTALEEELHVAKGKLKDLEDAQSAVGGNDQFSVAGLQKEVSGLREERDAMHKRLSGIEDELATEKSRVESLKEDRQELRKEFECEQQEIRDQLTREKTAHEDNLEESKKLRGDLAGVQARLRSITEAD